MSELVAARALLEHIRSIKQLMQSTPANATSQAGIIDALRQVLSANVLLVAMDGTVMYQGNQNGNHAVTQSPDQALRLHRIEDTELQAETEYPAVAAWVGKPRLIAVPVVTAGRRVATLLLGRDEALDPVDEILLEYAASVIGLELLRQGSAAREADTRRRSAVEQALSALSYSEQEAVRVLFSNLEGHEGVVVASRIADSVGLTRSVIVNALRKLESAGVITSRSLGMKGTYVKVLNQELLPAVKNAG